MARKSPSRMELRRQAEAAEAQQPGGEAAPKKSKKGADKEKAPKAEKAPKKAAARVKKTKEKAVVRKKLVWVVYSPGMKEEGRFAYDKRGDAEKRVEVLREKHKKPYFIQPVKEVISDGGVAVASPPKDDEPAPKRSRARAPRDDDDEDEVERDDDDD